MNKGFLQQEDCPNIVLPASMRQYELRFIISHDHLSQVFSAWDTQLCRDVWIRWIKHKGENAEHILSKARLAAALKDPAFVRIHALEEGNEELLIVSEAVVGMPLLDWAVQNKANQKAIFGVTMQIASALAEVHQVGLVHGDIQAKQFVVDANRKVRLLNCGFVSGSSLHKLDSIEQIDHDGGIAYLAPERFADVAATPASDVYALGTLLYQMLEGSLPFAHLQGLAMVAALVQSDAEHWPSRAEIAPALRQWMMGMLKRVPEQRLSCDQILAEGLVIREAEGYSSSHSSINLQRMQVQQTSLVRRNRYKKFALLACVALLAIGGAWHAQPYLPKIVKTLTPYSEQREFEGAMQAILLSDQPEMLDKAEQHFTKILEHDANNARAIAGLSICYSIRLNSDSRDEVWRERAIASAQQAMKLNPNLGITQIALARALDPHQQFDLAIQAARRAKELEPKNLLAWRTEIHILLIAQKYDDLSRVLDSASQKFPNDWFVSFYKGVQYINQRKYGEAEKALKLGISQRPDSTSPYAYLAFVMREQGRLDEALRVLQQGLQIRANATLYSQLAELKQSQGDYVAAVNAWQNAVTPNKGNPGDYSAWKDLGYALRFLPNKKAESLQAFTEAQRLLEPRLKRRPKDFNLNLNMVFISFFLGQMDRARELTDYALTLYPKSKDFYLFSALIYDASGKRAEATKELLLAKSLGATAFEIESDPDFSELIKDPVYLKHR